MKNGEEIDLKQTFDDDDDTGSGPPAIGDDRDGCRRARLAATSKMTRAIADLKTDERRCRTRTVDDGRSTSFRMDDADATAQDDEICK